jgi:ectoine hydroxylase-related dioxygenase (phytanoyl-CoA dioxygenase family)
MLSAQERSQWADQGFLALPRLLRPAAIEEVRALLDPVFARFPQLPSHVARDLADGRADADMARSAEIERPSRIEPQLRATEAFAACQSLAQAIAGPTARYAFDHAIYKAPYNDSATPWHQDQAYTGHQRLLQTVHFWIPLQPATIENGCMHFIPRSHVGGLVRHRVGGNGHLRTAAVGADARSVACPLPVGGVTIHSPLTLHYTGPNRTASVRKAWILHFGPWGRLAKLHPSILYDRIVSRWHGAPRLG